MKKTLFLATVLVTGLASVALAQFSNGKTKSVSESAICQNANGLSRYYAQDTTKKPVKDTIPPKTDSLPSKKDSASSKN